MKCKNDSRAIAGHCRIAGALDVDLERGIVTVEEVCQGVLGDLHSADDDLGGSGGRWRGAGGGGGLGHHPLVDLLEGLELDDRARVLILLVHDRPGGGGGCCLHHRDVCGGLINSLSSPDWAIAIDRVIHG